MLSPNAVGLLRLVDPCGEGGGLRIAEFWLFVAPPPLVGATRMGSCEVTIGFGLNVEGGVDGAAVVREGSWVVNIDPPEEAWLPRDCHVQGGK